MTADTVILDAHVLTLDAADRVIANGGLALANGRILAVGQAEEIRAAYPAAKVIDAQGRLVMPGLINTHAHCGDSLFRGLVDDMALEPWLQTLWVAEKAFVTHENVKLGAKLGFAELLKSGVTTVMDMFWHPDAAAEAANEAHIRIATGGIVFDFEGPDGKGPETRLPEAKAFIRRWRGDNLVMPSINPHGAYTVSPEPLRAAAELARTEDVLFSVHAAETQVENQTVADRYGKSVITHLNSLGALFEGAVLAHCVYPQDGEIELLARSKAAVAHCPVSNLKLASGIAPMAEMQAAGVRLTLGTDGPVSGNDMDLWLAIRLAAILHKGAKRDPLLFPARQVLYMATVHAAQALKRPDLGSLETGKQADLLFIRLDRAHLAPVLDIHSLAVYAIGRGDIEHVMVGGRMVVQDHRLTTLDEAELVAATNRLAPAIKASIQ